MSIADRSILACWGVKGGKAGRPFQITVDPGGPDEHDVDALADAEPLAAGTVVRIRTTGGGGWGDPLDRPVDEMLRDIAWRKVSVAGAREDYGVVVGEDGSADLPATEELRASLRAARTGDEPFFDRGLGYATLSGGAAFNEFDVL
jgi:N-methylhydantoinase B